MPRPHRTQAPAAPPRIPATSDHDVGLAVAQGAVLDDHRGDRRRDGGDVCLGAPRALRVVDQVPGVVADAERPVPDVAVRAGQVLDGERDAAVGPERGTNAGPLDMGRGPTALAAMEQCIPITMCHGTNNADGYPLDHDRFDRLIGIAHDLGFESISCDWLAD
jgi:hypothetical protein